MSKRGAVTNTSDIHGPTLLLIRGLPGSGKTYLAEALRESIGRSKVVMLDPDAIDFDSPAYQEHTKTLTAQGIEGKLHPYRFLRAHAQRAISGHKIILWNQPFSLAGGFQRTIENLRAYAVDRNIRLPILTVEVAIDPIIAQARIADRKEQGGHGPSDERFERFVNEYVSFADMGQDHTITVQGDGDVTVAVAAVLAALRALEQPQV